MGFQYIVDSPGRRSGGECKHTAGESTLGPGELCMDQKERGERTIFRQAKNGSGVGLPSKFRSEKIPRNRLGTVFVIPRKKMFIPPRNSVFLESVNFTVRNRMN